MIYLIVGGSHAGKTSFVKNSFIRNKQIHVYKDLTWVTETDDCYLLGRYDLDKRAIGTDCISRCEIPVIPEQIDRLLSSNKNNIVLEGDKICSRTVFNHVKSLNVPTKLYWIRVSPEISIQRNKEFNTTVSNKLLKSVCTKAKNIYYEYCDIFDGEIFDTDNESDFKTFSMCTRVGIKDISHKIKLF